MKRSGFAVCVLIVLLTCTNCFSLLKVKGSSSNPISVTVEPAALSPLQNLNSSNYQLEIPTSPSAIGDNFTVQIHLRNATVTNIDTGIYGVEVHFYFGNILTYAVPTQFVNMIGQPGGVLNGPDLLYGLGPGFFDAQGSQVQSQNYSSAAYFDVGVSSSDKPWNGLDGLIATITFRIINQPQHGQNGPKVTLPLINDFSEIETLAVIDPNMNITFNEDVSHDDIAGSLIFDSAYESSANYSLTVQTSPQSSGSVNVNVAGINQTSPYSFPNGTVIQTYASANMGWIFSSWTLDGINEGSSNPLYIIMQSNYSITANFISVAQPSNLTSVELTAEPSVLAPLIGFNSTPYNLEVPPGQVALGDLFAVYLHLRNATVGNVPNGIHSIGVNLSFGNISEFAQPLSFQPQMLGGPDGMLNPDIRFSIAPGFYDANGNLTAYPYDNATCFRFSAYSTGAGWNDINGVLAVLTFQIIKQPQASSGETNTPLSFNYVQAVLTDSKGETVSHDTIKATVTLDAICHHIALTWVSMSKTTIAQGFFTCINVTVANLGNIPDNFILTVYANASVINSETISLPSGNITTLSFERNTTAFTKGVYIVRAEAQIIRGEMIQADNIFAAGSMTVTIPGDINGDGKVDLGDLVQLTRAFGSQAGQPNWNPNADIDGNGIVNQNDLAVLVQNYGRP